MIFFFFNPGAELSFCVFLSLQVLPHVQGSVLVVRSPKLSPIWRGYNLDGCPSRNTPCYTLSFVFVRLFVFFVSFFFFLAFSFFPFYIYQWPFRSILFHSDDFFVLFNKFYTTCRNDKISAKVPRSADVTPRPGVEDLPNWSLFFFFIACLRL